MDEGAPPLSSVSGFQANDDEVSQHRPSAPHKIQSNRETHYPDRALYLIGNAAAKDTGNQNTSQMKSIFCTK